jgi:ubiquitin-like-conjugating enzyme ATG3
MAKRFLYEKFKDLHNAVSGPMTESTFQATGKLTPQEFVEAGDALVEKFPVWKWAGGDANVQPFLPANKKYLILQDCPCRERAPAADGGEGQQDAEGDDGWVTTNTDWTAPTAPQGAAAAPAAAAAAADAPMKWGEDEDEEEDANAAPVEATSDCKGLRFYNLIVSYDQYYCTPRMYLFGYSAESRDRPLTKEEMMEDVYSANREKTVTVDPFPFLQAPCVSIHPCRHAEMMQRVLQRVEGRYNEEQATLPAGERKPFVFPTFLALFVFLKFIAAVVPTIMYDVSIDMEM